MVRVLWSMIFETYDWNDFFCLPYRYAPETLSHNKYSFSSDIWSFGIVNFEMFSHGQEPNLVPGQELTPYELVDRLMKGDRYAYIRSDNYSFWAGDWWIGSFCFSISCRLPRPLKCPQNIYDNLMMPCWRGEPKERPDFTRLLQIINGLIEEYGENV